MLDKILIIDCGSKKTPNIEEVVEEYCDFDTLLFFEINENIIQNYKGVIISGSPILIHDTDMTPFIHQIEWIKNIKIPVLGICFGHQLIGLSFDAFPVRMKENRSFNEIESIEDSILLNRLPKIFEMQEDHCECISIPMDFKLIATSDDCINEIMQHETKSIFGVQFHPEVSGNFGYVLIENFVNICFED